MIPALLLAAEEAVEGAHSVLGWAIVAAGGIDLALALILARRPNPAGAPNMLPLILALSGFGMLAIGGAFLLGVLG